MTKLTGSLGVRNEINVDIIGTGARGKEGKSAYETWLDLGNEGTEQEYLASLKGEKGDKGDAATVSVGAVTTGEAGTDASVENVGTSSAAVFNFVIPRGDKGERGEQGIQGVQGETGPKGDKGDQGIRGEDGDPLQIVNDLTTGGADKALSAEQGKVLNGRLPKPYELLETITLTENVASIVRTQEPDGTPYSFERLRLMVHTTAATDSSNLSVSAFCGKTKITSLGMSGLLNTSDRYSMLEFYDDNNIWSAGATSAAGGFGRTAGTFSPHFTRN